MTLGRGGGAGINSVFAVDACRTPVGKIKGALAAVRPDHLSADVIAGLLARNRWLDPARIDDVYWGAANQAGEDNRNEARMAALLAGLPVEIPGATVNRLCGSGMEAIACAARAIAAGEAEVCLAGGAESMTRAPFVLPRAEGPGNQGPPRRVRIAQPPASGCGPGRGPVRRRDRPGGHSGRGGDRRRGHQG